ncbi:MAG: TonB-dependent receptor [Azovibrio sp.]|nr:TonB-dependent receptor [Azovibrio sp.]
MYKLQPKPLALALAGLFTAFAHAEDKTLLDEVSVTATRDARPTREVPQAIAVIGSQQIEDAKMFNIKDALQGIPGVLVDTKNGGYDSRLIIRGAGLKAPFGVREIMVLRDGVPLTDPDSMTRFDWVDTEDLERIEVFKGPGSPFAAGIAGGTLQFVSRSVFDNRADRIKLGFGEWGSQLFNARVSALIGADQAVALSLTRRKQDNSWRNWNTYESTQVSFKHGLMLTGGGSWETELAYSEADMQLPGSLNAADFETFKRTGRQKDTSEAWKHSGRYSQIWFFNTRLEKEVGDWSFRPRFYVNQWQHYHPVTGLINDSAAWVRNIGTDLEGTHHHSLFGRKAELVAGITVRSLKNPDSRKYQYAEVSTIPFGPQAGRITATLSDKKGALAAESNQKNLLTGLFLFETLRPVERLTLDFGARYDRSRVEIDETEYSVYNYSTGKYTPYAAPLTTRTRHTFKLFSPKLGATWKLNEAIHLYASLAQADQVPTDSELSSNPNLAAPTVRNAEMGMKLRTEASSLDVALYKTRVTDEIITVRENGENVFQNAGRTAKTGLEISGLHRIGPWELGAGYGYADYRYDQFSEVVRTGFVSTNVDRAGKRLPYVPRHQGNVSVRWRAAGWKLGISGQYWGTYYLDNANSETYTPGWTANLMAGYGWGPKEIHSLTLNVENLANKYYAMQVTKDTSGKVSYTTASPRAAFLTYRYQF